MGNADDPSFKERRKYKRAGMKADVEYKVLRLLPHAIECEKPAPKRRAESVNISIGGMQIVDDVELPAGQIIQVRFKPENNEKIINAFARVRWSNYDSQLGKHRIGMEFYYLNSSDRDSIKKITEDKT